MDYVGDEFRKSLHKKVSGLKEVYSLDQCHAILFFCTIVSRAGTDIDAAIKDLDQVTTFKPVIMVILHSTFDPEKIFPDSNHAIQRENIFAVDCLIFDNKLLGCQKNEKAIMTTAQYFKSKNLTSYYCLNKDRGNGNLFTDQSAENGRLITNGDPRQKFLRWASYPRWLYALVFLAFLIILLALIGYFLG
ncbi:uncharacterized protein LOC143738934 [Siphateles boraxobius]|uniref:uncharacterized protein LOC143738934 n=1 Tax=Siphateles boraxobius TaxID=180520 RepID=UPI004062828E